MADTTNKKFDNIMNVVIRQYWAHYKKKYTDNPARLQNMTLNEIKATLIDLDTKHYEIAHDFVSLVLSNALIFDVLI